MAYLYVDYFAGAAATRSFLWCLISLKKKNHTLNPGMRMWLECTKQYPQVERHPQEMVPLFNTHKCGATSTGLCQRPCSCRTIFVHAEQKHYLKRMVCLCKYYSVHFHCKYFLPFITPWELLPDKSELSTSVPYMFLFTHGCYCVLPVKNYVFYLRKIRLYKLPWMLYTILYCLLY